MHLRPSNHVVVISPRTWPPTIRLSSSEPRAQDTAALELAAIWSYARLHGRHLSLRLWTASPSHSSETHTQARTGKDADPSMTWGSLSVLKHPKPFRQQPASGSAPTWLVPTAQSPRHATAAIAIHKQPKTTLVKHPPPAKRNPSKRMPAGVHKSSRTAAAPSPSTHPPSAAILHLLRAGSAPIVDMALNSSSVAARLGALVQHQSPNNPRLKAYQAAFALASAAASIQESPRVWAVLSGKSYEAVQVLSGLDGDEALFRQRADRLAALFERIVRWYNDQVRWCPKSERIFKAPRVRRKVKVFLGELTGLLQGIASPPGATAEPALDDTALSSAIRQDEEQERLSLQRLRDLLLQDRTAALVEMDILLDRQHEWQIRRITDVLQTLVQDADPAMAPSAALLLEALQSASAVARSIQPESWRIPFNAVTNWSPNPIAGGGFGLVYRATYYGSDVAIKQLLCSYEEAAIAEFRREISVWHRLNHPNILPLLGACDTVEKPFMVSPFMKNGTLRNHVSNPDAARPLAEKLRLMYDVASGMAYLHGNHIVHGDLKSDNVFIDSGGHGVVADFGLSRTKSTSSASRKQVPGGTMEYMAPEMLGVGKDEPTGSSKKSDVYAFGITFYEVLHNGRIWTTSTGVSQTQQQILSSLMQGRRPRRTDGIPDDIWALIDSCWQDDDALRPSFSSILAALQPYRPPHGRYSKVRCLAPRTQRHIPARR
ncbi:kinase-like domain-containing protein [Polychytrium aggregatum]|uniref:kinase-like domain-containing protein n=1 Tax=Polychytrium aggregatum TaxID=110093 RepID=UPI0022FEA580|nr:kinase-like domain-containing protein [Polychytrium aggregatum]KAI9202495.1 kinase-like domain-containing protein [Polychytrium aggregatum]